MSPLPNFFVVGAPKAGTTALYHYLRQHPDVYMSPIKEPGFFADELRPERVSAAWRQHMARQAQALQAFFDDAMRGRPPGGVVAEWTQYLRLFAPARDDQAIGEASAAYLWSRTAAGGIAARVPGARIIMVLRNPIERALSQHLQRVSEDRARLSFGETIRQSAEAQANGAEQGRGPDLLAFGAYAAQVERFLDRFPRERIRIYLYEEFSRDPALVLRDIFALLRVREDVAIDVSARYMEAKVPRFPRLERRLLRPLARRAPAGPPFVRRLIRRLRFVPRDRLGMAASDRRFLREFYADDVRRLSASIGRDLSHWLRDSG